MTHTSIHRSALAILAIAAGIAFALTTTATPASARTFYFNSAGSMVQQPLPTEWSCVLQRALNRRSQRLQCRAASTAASTSSGRPGLNATGADGPTPPANTLAHRQPSPPTIVRVTAPNSGFDWGDAGIGAAGTLALTTIGVGVALAISQTHAGRSTS